jgi:hypothetical protein
MKAKILLLAFLLPVLVVHSQSNQNSSVAIFYQGTEGNKFVVKVDNKQPCTAKIRVSYDGLNVFKDIAGNSSDTVQFIPTESTTVTAKALTDCGSVDRNIVTLPIPVLIGLPVKFTSFAAKTVSNGISLEWKTEELNIDHFIVQESSDGVNWNKEAIVKAGSGTYTWLDINPLNFYRIASVDIDGIINYSKVIRLSIGAKEEISVFPNPVKNTASISLKSNNQDYLNVYNSGGVLVKKINVKGKSAIVADLSDLKSGIYYINKLKIVKE